MIPEFAMRLICGLSTVWCLAPRAQITSGYFRIQMLVTLGLSVLAMVTARQIRTDQPTTDFSIHSIVFALALVTALLSFVGSSCWALDRRRGGEAAAVFVLIFSISGVAAIPASVDYALPIDLIGSLGDAFSSAWLLGATTAAMLLGHWYLTATGMSLTPLKQYTATLGAAVILRIMFAGWTAFSLAEQPGTNWTLLALRWGGLIGPLVMAGLTLQILKFRNTQSATGVLYAATVLVFMGEMASELLARSQANPPGV